MLIIISRLSTNYDFFFKFKQFFFLFLNYKFDFSFFSLNLNLEHLWKLHSGVTQVLIYPYQNHAQFLVM
jgi:hypothetical protein